MGCMLFGVFFCFSRSFAQDFAVDFDFHVEGLVVVRSFAAAQFVFDVLRALLLDVFLEEGLIVFFIMAALDQVQVALELVKNEFTGFFIGTVNINRTDDGFKGVGHDARPRASSRSQFPLAQEDIVPHVELGTDRSQRRFADDTGPGLGQFPFGHVGIMKEQIFTYDQVQDGIAQKFQAFVVIAVAGLVFIGIG